MCRPTVIIERACLVCLYLCCFFQVSFGCQAKDALCVVLTRCAENVTRVQNDLKQAGIPYIIMQQNRAEKLNKYDGPCGRSLSGGIREGGELVNLQGNMGNECRGYLRMILQWWDDLPERILFLQGYPYDQMLESNLPRLLSCLSRTAYGYVPVNKHMYYKKIFPFPHTDGYTRDAHGCTKRYWTLASQGREQEFPGLISYYKGAQFMVSRERIKAVNKEVYQDISDRFEGRRITMCLWQFGKERLDTGADCMALERLWHVLFGERTDTQYTADERCANLDQRYCDGNGCLPGVDPAEVAAVRAQTNWTAATAKPVKECNEDETRCVFRSQPDTVPADTTPEYDEKTVVERCYGEKCWKVTKPNPGKHLHHKHKHLNTSALQIEDSSHDERVRANSILKRLDFPLPEDAA
ncbi:hypothetical protein CYMTET_48697 [Cymbomonas tetramitiformis]|uniref:Uncharacterized protein n=1 Tax=Cymbomonas tetramitiformis TaxID=36881 RepID=A0AAE0BSU8_9CHLO|nr:hypothetical protein CYMTET_48697 [Cymbomonas tetramitiformis]